MSSRFSSLAAARRLLLNALVIVALVCWYAFLILVSLHVLGVYRG